MKTPILKAVAAALMLAAAGCATAPPDLNDDLVVPGERVGPIVLGMPLSQLLAVLGTPQTTTPIAGSAAASYSWPGLTVAAHETVYWIIATDPRYRTASGVSPGVEHIVARAAMPKPDCVATRTETTLYDYGNFYFEVDNMAGRVAQLGVQKKTTACEP
jgi:hypothetical protein